MTHMVKKFLAISSATYVTHWFILTICGEWFGKLSWLIGYISLLLLSAYCSSVQASGKWKFQMASQRKRCKTYFVATVPVAHGRSGN